MGGGALTLEQAFELASHRSRLEQTLVGRGGMVAVDSSSASCAPRASRSPRSTAASFTLTGDVDAIAASGKRLTVSVAYHRATPSRWARRSSAPPATSAPRAPDPVLLDRRRRPT